MLGALFASSPLLAGTIGPTSTYYLTAGSEFRNWMINGDHAVSSAQTGAYDYLGQFAIAIPHSDIRTLVSGGLKEPGGGLYDLAFQAILNLGYANPAITVQPDPLDIGSNPAAQPAGGWWRDGFAYPVADAEFYDGASDGVHNYTVDFNTGDVYQMNADWSDPHVLFTLSPDIYTSFLGITFDRELGTLWLSEYGGSWVRQFDLHGHEISQFDTGASAITALAMDYRDGTLWLGHADYSGTFEQFSRTGPDVQGNPLQTITYADMAGDNVLGGEIATPEPGTMFTLGGACGLLALFARRLKWARP
jgi:hypothetical protein